MALTRITKGVIKPNENYDTHNINSTGIVTAIGLDVNGNGDISGNLNVGGVLTYEDVTSIDSVGIITAQKDIHVGAGVSAVGIVTAATFKGDGDFVDIDVDGHTNLDNVSIAGVTTTSGNIIIENTEPSLFLTDTNGNPDYKIFNDAGAFKIYDTTYSATRLQIGPSNGEMTVLSNTNFPNGITMNPGTASVVNTIAQRLGNTTAKIRFPANDTFTVETAGSTRLKAENSGVVITGVTSITASAHVSNANGSVFFGAGNATAYGSQGGIGRASNANYHIGSSAPGDLCIAAEGSKRILFGTKTGTGIGGITKRMSIASSGTVTIDGNLDAVGGIDATANSTFAGDIDVDGHTNLDNVSIAGVTTFTGRSDHSSSLQMLAGNNIVLLNDANSANCQIDCYGGAGFRLTSYNQTMFTCENGNSTKFYTNSGTSRLEITNGGDVLVNTGTLHIPDALTHLGDTNTRIRFPSSDTITAETAGTERLRITSAGEVKIMNTSGTVGLYFQSSSGAVSNFRAIGTNNQSLGYFFGNTEKVRFGSDGQIGIGTDNPTGSLQGNWSRILAISAGTSNGSMIRFLESSSAAGGNNTGMLVGQHDSNSYIVNYQNGFMSLRTNNAEKLRITSGGTVNIGGDYTNTTGKLKVTGVVTVDGGFNLTAGTLTAPGGFSISSGNVIISGDIAHDADSDTTFGFGAGNDTFRVKTAGTERISVSGGYVGINVTNPQAFLDIGGNADGDVKASFTRANDPNFRIQVRNESSSNNVGASQGKFGLFYASNSADICGMQFHRGSSTGAGSLSFTTGGTERLSIDSNGVVTISNSSPPATGAMTFITDDGSATTLGTSATLRVANDGSNGSYSVFEAESAQGCIRLSNDGRTLIGDHIGSPDATLHVIGKNNDGQHVIAQFGKTAEARYARFVAINNQQNFDHLLLRRYDNNTTDVLRLQNTYASGTGWGTGIGWYGHGGNVTGRIKVVNATTNSSVARMHLEVNNQSIIHMDHAPNRTFIGQPSSAGGFEDQAPLQTRSSQSNTGCFSGTTTNYNTLFGLLPWASGGTYLSSGITYNNGSWIHKSDNNDNCLLYMRGGGWQWYSSNNASGSWNVASSVNIMSSTGVWTGGTSSDRRLKDNITNMSSSDALTKVTQLQGVSYTWKNEVQKKFGEGPYPEGTHHGFIAQDVKTVWPDAHIITQTDNENDFDDDPTKDVKDDVYYGEIEGVKEEKMVPLLVEAIKELKKENDALKARVTTLEG